MIKDQKSLFSKLKIYTLLDLALILPTKYEDTTLSKRLNEGEICTLEAKVTSAGYKNGRFCVTFFLPSFGLRVWSIFFRATAYHERVFAPDCKLYIQGKLKRHNGYWQMPQPKVVDRANEIVPKYRTQIAQKELKELLIKNITIQNLTQEGLKATEAKGIYDLHFPKDLSQIYDQEREMLDKNISLLKFVEAYNHIRKLRRKKVNFLPIHALCGDESSFVNSLPFELTGAQKKTIKQIKTDISKSNKSARRVVIGDVGSGKTMVMFACAIMALPHKSIIMAPTSLLAAQIYEEAQKYLDDFLDISLLTKRKKHGSIKDADLLIGTHALLYAKDLPQAALLMTDEQHRFGSAQRQMLQTLVSKEERRPHYIQFSATPIPRTQAMIQSELISVSIMNELPFKKNITTKVVGSKEFSSILSHIEQKTQNGEQTLIVYPLVQKSDEVPYQSIEEGRGFWERRFEKVYTTYGKDAQKEQVLEDFRKDGSILLATTVVEVGISLPKLTTIVVVGAERLGLATLHQLRGRVGRHGQSSSCFLFTRVENSKRLEEFSKTLDGFEIAKLDLKYRDSGDIIDGTIQSGQRFRWLDLAEDESIVVEAKRRVKKLIDKD